MGFFSFWVCWVSFIGRDVFFGNTNKKFDWKPRGPRGDRRFRDSNHYYVFLVSGFSRFGRVNEQPVLSVLNRSCSGFSGCEFCWQVETVLNSRSWSSRIVFILNPETMSLRRHEEAVFGFFIKFDILSFCSITGTHISRYSQFLTIN